MVHFNQHTEVKEQKASEILEKQMNDLLLTLLEKEITEYCLNYLEDIRTIANSTKFGKYVKRYFKQLRNWEQIEDEDATKIFIELYLAIKTNCYIELNDIQKTILLCFIYFRQAEFARIARENILQNISYMMDGDYIRSVSTANGFYIVQVKIHPSEYRKYIYNYFRKLYPKYDKKKILQQIYTYEHVQYIYSRVCKNTQWQLKETEINY